MTNGEQKFLEFIFKIQNEATLLNGNTIFQLRDQIRQLEEKVRSLELPTIWTTKTPTEEGTYLMYDKQFWNGTRRIPVPIWCHVMPDDDAVEIIFHDYNICHSVTRTLSRLCKANDLFWLQVSMPDNQY